jgi:hypothetical protein
MTLVRFKRKPVIEPVGTHIYPDYNEKRLRGTLVWPFYRKMRVRHWKPLHHVLEINKIDGRTKCLLIYYFKHDKTNRVLAMHISRHEQLYFTVAKGADVYQSDYCDNFTEFDVAFCKYFKRKNPVLAAKTGF